MKKVAIIGAGPTGIYTFLSLLSGQAPLSVTIYEQADEAGVGMPYSEDENSHLMLANIASIEIPPITSTYLDWLRDQSEDWLARYGVDKSTLHDRQFLPRILLGEYFRSQFLGLLELAPDRGFEVEVREACRVADLEAASDGVRLWAEGDAEPALFDFIVIATGHVWPDEDEATRSFFPSPWSGLVEARIRPCKVGIMGTSLSGIDAAMAVVGQHGQFAEAEDETLRFELDDGSDDLTVTLMSRSGILPEADFYCPIPYAPLQVATKSAIEKEIASGPEGLLDRIFALVSQEIREADPAWSERVRLGKLDADSFADAYFADRERHDPFRWAEYNLREVERNKRDRHTVPWRYAILRLHEAVQDVVPHLDDRDRERFDAGLGRVFIDNYAAIPSESIRRLLALRTAGIVGLLELGNDYEMNVESGHTDIQCNGEQYQFDIFIDARGQKPLATADLPFPTLREQLKTAGDEVPNVGDNYTLMSPDEAKGRVAFGSIPYLMHDQPFIQGITASAEIGSVIAKAIGRPASGIRRYLPFLAA
ncbi:FAD-NAD(P)-binding protein [Paracoccus alkanivorans]|uniref:FAD-NAD(P)-binding protein n=2 Tax=Paracoccus alkanivorans TaxID=2116655 RepID=A0A3M0MJH7_9RHOB|nr:FAD-NAD(P)-binding protein [Paracoccus alkanivorans]RMC37223.1 FAD-NAD(P)-binding protein [Paracoccus alkanivorans]